MGNNSVPKFIFHLSRFPVYRGSVLGRFYCIRSIEKLHMQRNQTKYNICTCNSKRISHYDLGYDTAYSDGHERFRVTYCFHLHGKSGYCPEDLCGTFLRNLCNSVIKPKLTILILKPRKARVSIIDRSSGRCNLRSSQVDSDPLHK